MCLSTLWNVTSHPQPPTLHPHPTPTLTPPPTPNPEKADRCDATIIRVRSPDLLVACVHFEYSRPRTVYRDSCILLHLTAICAWLFSEFASRTNAALPQHLSPASHCAEPAARRFARALSKTELFLKIASQLPSGSVIQKQKKEGPLVRFQRRKQNVERSSEGVGQKRSWVGLGQVDAIPEEPKRSQNDLHLDHKTPEGLRLRYRPNARPTSSAHTKFAQCNCRSSVSDWEAKQLPPPHDLLCASDGFHTICGTWESPGTGAERTRVAYSRSETITDSDSASAGQQDAEKNPE